jgi:hypothetical protein
MPFAAQSERGRDRPRRHETRVPAELRDEAPERAAACCTDRVRSVEHHEKYHDVPELPHLIIMEASGRGGDRSKLLEGPREDYRGAISVV